MGLNIRNLVARPSRVHGVESELMFVITLLATNSCLWKFNLTVDLMFSVGHVLTLHSSDSCSLQ
jgi:hypothetical protein